VTTRLATVDDLPLLWQMLALAASLGGEGEEEVARAKADPGLRGYVEGYGRDGDLGLVAVDGAVGLGAAWLRLQSGPDHPAKVWTAEEPELVIATSIRARGRGVGRLLLGDLVRVATGRYPAIRLTVREGNEAVRLYRSFDFVEEGRIVNRVGSVSLVMRLALRP
jgi:ribosomal protein S18 acetylase RimI-like enzyme